MQHVVLAKKLVKGLLYYQESKINNYNQEGDNYRITENLNVITNRYPDAFIFLFKIDIISRNVIEDYFGCVFKTSDITILNKLYEKWPDMFSFNYNALENMKEASMSDPDVSEPLKKYFWVNDKMGNKTTQEILLKELDSVSDELMNEIIEYLSININIELIIEFINGFINSGHTNIIKLLYKKYGHLFKMDDLRRILESFIYLEQ